MSLFHKRNLYPFEGRWCGDIVFVNVEYSFDSIIYIQKTKYNNDMIGGTKGNIVGSTDKIIILHQTHEFQYGNWYHKEMDYNVEYFVESNGISISPSFASDSLIMLKKCE